MTFNVYEIGNVTLSLTRYSDNEVLLNLFFFQSKYSNHKTTLVSTVFYFLQGLQSNSTSLEINILPLSISSIEKDRFFRDLQGMANNCVLLRKYTLERCTI